MLSLIVIIILLVLFDVIIVVYTGHMKRLLHDCETNESDFCPSYICPDGNPASRKDERGVMCSGSEFIKEFKAKQDRGDCKN